jgi:hypothetical protein
MKVKTMKLLRIHHTNRAYLLPVALALFTFLILLSLSLSYLTQQGSLQYRYELNHNQFELQTGDAVAQYGSMLDGSPVPHGPQSSAYKYIVDAQLGIVAKADSDPIDALPFKKTKTGGFVHGDEPLPSIGYQQQRVPLDLTDISVPAETTLVEMHRKKGSRHTTVFSAAFPFGIYAPQGSVEVGRVTGWTNPPFDIELDEGEVVQHLSGAAVDIRAGLDVTTGYYPHGKVYSDSGPITIEKGRAIPFIHPEKSPTILSDPSVETLEQQAETAFYNISDGSVDKTEFIYAPDGPINSAEGLITLIQKTIALASLKSGTDAEKFTTELLERVVSYSSIQQASMVPFFSIIGIPEVKEGWLEVDLFVPFPPDRDQKVLQLLSHVWKNGIKILSQLCRIIGDVTGMDVASHVMVKFVVHLIEGKGLPTPIELVAWTLEAAKESHTKVDLEELGKLLEEVLSGTGLDLLRALEDLSGFADLFNMIRVVNDSIKLIQGWLAGEAFDPDKLLALGLTFPPVTKHQEEFMPEGWTIYWPFAYLLENGIEGAIKIVKDIIPLAFGAEFDPKALALALQPVFDTMAVPCRVYHFDGTRPDFYFADGLPQKSDLYHWYRPTEIPDNYTSLKCTLAVPPSRTLRIQGNLQVRGDLWIRRGAAMVVDGNLLLTKPTRLKNERDPWPEYDTSFPEDEVDRIIRILLLEPEPEVLPDPAPESLRPRGRLLLEEGATLLVSGDLNIEGGDANGGSIICTSSYGEIHPVTAAVLAEGNVKVRYGTGSGVRLPDLLTELGEKHGVQDADKWAASLRDLEDLWGPNLAKIAGPFDFREGWFAKPVALIVIMAEIPIPLILPTMEENILNTVYGFTSIYYRVVLNGVLGENLFTHTEWWPYGVGVVPILAKIPPDKKVAESWQPKGEPPEFSSELFVKAIEESLHEDLPDLAVTLVMDTIGAIINTIFNYFIDFSPHSDKKALEEIMEVIQKTAVNILHHTIDAVIKTIESSAKSLDKTISAAIIDLDVPEERDRVLREVPGVLLQAGKKLTIGSDDYGISTDSPMAAGLFVAKDDIEIKTELTVGSVISSEGNVELKDLRYYPYFTHATLYQPWTPGDQDIPYAIRGLFSKQKVLGQQVFQIPLVEQDEELAPQRVTSGPAYHVTAEGWSR